MPETRGQSAKSKIQRAANEDDGSAPAKTTGPPNKALTQEQPASSRKFRITNFTGDLTSDPPKNAVLIHSVNCVGKWGSGIALALAKKFPAAFEMYKYQCKTKSPIELLGTCYLNWPQKDAEDPQYRWIASLFVSEGYGSKTKTKPGKAKPADITRYTKMALESLRKVLEACLLPGTPGHDIRPDVNELWACKFNSGSFGVKWDTTVKVIEEVFDGWEGEMKVVSHE